MKSLVDYEVADPLPARKWIPDLIQIRQYAEAAGDFNPIHLDEAYARKMGLGGVIAHGMLTMAQMAAMLTEWLASQGEIYKFEVRFQQVVHPGDAVLFSGTVRARSKSVLVCDLTAVNQRDEQVLAGSAHILIKEEF